VARLTVFDFKHDSTFNFYFEKERTRDVVDHHQGGGKACEANVEKRTCLLTDCPDP